MKKYMLHQSVEQTVNFLQYKEFVRFHKLLEQHHHKKCHLKQETA